MALFGLTAITELVGAVMLLRGSDFGRVMTMVFSGLQLFNIPIGTAVGAYSLWALLRKVPEPKRQMSKEEILEALEASPISFTASWDELKEEIR